MPSTIHATTRAALSTALATLALLAAQAAHADTGEAKLLGTAPNTCQAALPAYEGQIRKRPLSVQNEGTAPASVTCSLAAGGAAKRSFIYVNSIDGQAHTVSCTVVLGYLGLPRYVSKSVDVVANGVQVILDVVPGDVGRTSDLGSEYVSYSCLLPPGAGLNDTAVFWNQYIGT